MEYDTFLSQNISFEALSELLNLIQKNKPHQQKAKGNDIAIMFGITGAGKSTFASYLSRKKLSSVKVELYNEKKGRNYKIKTIQVAEGEQEVSKIGVGFKSETKNIISCQINNKRGQCLMLIDTPGFLDTNGPIIDIANSVSIIQTLYEAKSVKIILLLGYKSLDCKEGKGKYVRDLIQLYGSLIKNINSCKESVLIAFNHLDEDTETEDIIDLITGLQNDETDLNVNNFLELAENNLKEDSQSCLIFPLQDGEVREEIINKIFNLKQIQHEDVPLFFEYALMEETKLKFIQMIEDVKKEAILHFEQEQYPKTEERFNILYQLQSEIQFPFVKSGYFELVDSLIKVDLIKKTLFEIDVFNNGNNEISQYTSELICKTCKYLSWVVRLSNLDERFTKKLISFATFCEILINNMQDKYDQLKYSNSFPTMINFLNKLKSFYFNKDLISIIQSSYSQYQSHKNKDSLLQDIQQQPFSEDLYVSACQFIKKKLDNLLQQLNHLINFDQNYDDNEDLDIKAIENKLNILKNAVEDDIDKHFENNYYRNAYQQFLDNLNNKVQLYLNYLENNTEINLSELNELRQRIKTAYLITQSIIIVSEHLKNEQLIAKYLQIEKKFIQISKQQSQEILLQTKLYQLKDQFIIFEQLTHLSQKIQLETHEEQIQCNLHLHRLVNNQVNKIQRNIKSFNLHSNNDNFQSSIQQFEKSASQVIKSFKKIQNATLIKGHEEIIKVYQTNLIDLQQVIVDKFKKLKEAEILFNQNYFNQQLNSLILIYTIFQCCSILYQDKSMKMEYFFEQMKEIINKVIISNNNENLSQLNIQYEKNQSEKQNILIQNILYVDIFLKTLQLNIINKIDDNNKEEIQKLYINHLNEINQKIQEFSLNFKNYFNENIFNIEEIGKFPSDPIDQKIILDECLYIKQFDSIYGLLKQDIYSILLEIALNNQKKLQQNIEDNLNSESDMINNISDKNLDELKKASDLYNTHLSNLIENKLLHFKSLNEMNKSNLEKKLKNYIKDYNFEELLKVSQSYSNKQESNYTLFYQSLEKRFKKLFKEIQNQMKLFSLSNTELINNIYSNLNVVKNAVDILNTNEFNELKLKEKLDQFKENLNSNLTIQVNEYKKLIQQFQFENAEQQKKKLVEYIQKVKLYCISSILSFEQESYRFTEISLQQLIEKLKKQNIANSYQHIQTLSNLKELQIYQPYFVEICSYINNEIKEEAKQIIEEKLLKEGRIHINLVKSILNEEYGKILKISIQETNLNPDNFFQQLLDHYQSLLKETNSILKENNLQEYVKLLDKYNHFSLISDRIIKKFEEYKQCIIEQDLVSHDYQKTFNHLSILKEYISTFNQTTFLKFKRSYNQTIEFIEEEYRKVKLQFIDSINDLESSDSLLKNTYNFYQFTNYFDKMQVQKTLEEIYQLITKNLEELQKNLASSIDKLEDLPTLIYSKLSIFIGSEKIGINEEQLKFFDIIKKFQNNSKMFFNSNHQIKNKLIENIKNGFWQIDTIQDSLIKKKMKVIIKEIQDQFNQKQYLKILENIKQSNQFMHSIKEIFKDLDYQEITKILVESYFKKCEQANQLWKDKQINHILYNELLDLGEIEKIFKDNIREIAESNNLQSIITQIEKQIESLAQEILSKDFKEESQWINFANSVINIRRISYEIGQVHDFTNDIIEKVISHHFQLLDTKAVHQISMRFRQNKFGMHIVQEHKRLFEQTLNEIMKKLTEGQSNSQYVLDNLQGDEFQAKDLSQQINYFYVERKKILDLWQIGELKSHDIILKTKQLVRQFTIIHKNTIKQLPITWDTQQKKELIDILAHVCSVWSSINCESQKSQFKILHTVQCLTIVRLLGIDTSSKHYTLKNHMIQLRTGEGKSITLGICAIMLALIGFKVDCCCYSQYLSQRDYDDFQHMFIKFNLEQYITYSTFDTLFEKIINKEGDLRKKMKQIFDRKVESVNENKESIQKQVLMIDEVDFFFGESFIGETHPTAFSYTNAQIITIFKFIWNNRVSNMNFQQFQTYPEYLELYSKNSSLQPWKNLIDQQITQMFEDVKLMDNHQYFIFTPEDNSKKLICYKQLDGISFNTVKGFKTAFAYIQEWEKKVIAEETMNENLTLIFNIGCYSFTEIPKQYDLILGVSGTLVDMNQYQRQKMKEFFNIQKQTITPSIFGETKLSYDKIKNVIMINDQNSYFQEIQKQIEQQIKANRAVLVFFDTKVNLDNFKCFLKTNEQIQTLTEETNFKNHVICKASSSKIITLSTRPFGRGCDFICTDPELIKAGGLHVIQTFLSDDLSEETQIKGRTARQTQKGSYSMILLKDDIVKQFSLSPNQQLDSIKLYDHLHQLRIAKQKIREFEFDKRIKNAELSHNISIELKYNIINYTINKNQQIIENLQKLQKFTEKKVNKVNQYSFYNSTAGKIGIGQDVAEQDQFHNPISSQYDLGIDGQYNNFSLLIGLFYTSIVSDIKNFTFPELQKKGFRECEVVTNEQNFILKLPNYDQAWVISNDTFHNSSFQNEFIQAVKTHISKQKGLMIWADNAPYTMHANMLLKEIPIGYTGQTPIHIQLDGNDHCDQILDHGSNNIQKQFGNHFITSGLNHVHEGITICSPRIISNTPQNNFGELEIIGKSSENKPCIMVLPGNKNRGRIVLDCGFTKLMDGFWQKTAGTQRYVKNCYVWLYWRERFAQME